jgi:hypothetical protein
MRGISDESLTVQCEPGEVATGGGAVFTSGSMELVQLIESRPDPLRAGATPTGWAVTVRSRSSQNYSFDVIVVCVEAP